MDWGELVAPALVGETAGHGGESGWIKGCKICGFFWTGAPECSVAQEVFVLLADFWTEARECSVVQEVMFYGVFGQEYRRTGVLSSTGGYIAGFVCLRSVQQDAEFA